MVVNVKIVDSTGKELTHFAASKNGSIVEDAHDAWYDIPVGCGAGACFVCMCKIKQWDDAVDIGKLQMPLIDIDQDQVLSCVWWMKDTYIDDAIDHTVILEREF